MPVMLGKAFCFAQVNLVTPLLPQPDCYDFKFILAQNYLITVIYFPYPKSQPEKIKSHSHGTDYAGTIKAKALIGPAAADRQQRHVGQSHLAAAPGSSLPTDFLILQKTPSNTLERFSETH